jgi:hypothetical protein
MKNPEAMPLKHNLPQVYNANIIQSIYENIRQMK